MMRHTGAILTATALAIAMPTQAGAKTLQVYAAGSLRAVVAALGTRAARIGIRIEPIFGGSGDLRARIAQGAAADLFLSADMAAPRALAAEGRAREPAIAFARNRLCLVAPRALGLTPANLLDRLTAPNLRVKTSRPIVDPSGDYAMAMFALIEARRPGAGRALRASAEQQMATTESTTALFAEHKIDVAVTYCSASGALAQSVPGLTSVAVPEMFDPAPVYGLAVLSDDPDAMRLALLLLSEDGQSDLAAAGLLPLLPGDKRPLP